MSRQVCSPPGRHLVAASVVPPAVDRLVAEGRFDYVYHFAAYAAEGLSHFIERFNYTNNVIGSVNPNMTTAAKPSSSRITLTTTPRGSRASALSNSLSR